MDINDPNRNVGMDLVRVTENAALAASRWIGSGNYAKAHLAAYQAMNHSLTAARISGTVIIGEEKRVEGQASLGAGHVFGDPENPIVDLAVDPIDGTDLLIKGRSGAISVMGIAPHGSLWSPLPAQYMEKIVVDREAAEVLVPECLDAPAAWTLALIARKKKKAVRDLLVIVLQRARHQDLIDEIRATGAGIFLLEQGDVSGALMAASMGTGADILMGIGGASQGILTACAVKALDGMMLARLKPQTAEERAAVEAAGLDISKIYTCGDMVCSDKVFFSATGVTDSRLLSGVRIFGNYADLHSLLIRSQTGTRRFIHAERNLDLFETREEMKHEFE